MGELEKAIEDIQNGATSISLGFSSIGDEGAKSLAAALWNNETVATLNLQDNKIGYEGAKLLAAALQDNETLTELYFGINEIGDKGVKSLAVPLQNNKTLSILSLYGNKIGDEGARSLKDFLQNNTTLTELYLWRNEIGDAGANSLAIALQNNNTLTTLHLSENRIGNEGAKVLADAFQNNKTLTVLDLGDNNIGDEGAKSLADAFRSNETLIELALSKNCITTEGWTKLADMLETNTSLQIFWVDKTDVLDEVAIGALLKVVARRFDDELEIKFGGHNDNSVKELQKLRKQIANQVTTESCVWGRCKLMVVGEGGVGKTQTLRSLCDEHFQEKRESTLGAATSLKQVHVDGSNFSKINCDAMHAKAILREQARKWSSDRIKPSQCKQNPTNNHKSDSAVAIRAELLMNNKVRKTMTSEDINTELIHNVANREYRSGSLKHRLSFTVWDFGGQEVFNAIHSLFLSSDSIYLLVFRMDTLTSNVEDDVTNAMDKLRFWFQSIQCHSPLAKLCFVGTHKDNCKGNINAAIDAILTGLVAGFSGELIGWDGHLFFPVDNANRDNDVFNELRKTLGKLAQNLAAVQCMVPVKWVLFLDYLYERQQQIFLHIEERDLRDFASKENMTRLITLLDDLCPDHSMKEYIIVFDDDWKHSLKNIGIEGEEYDNFLAELQPRLSFCISFGEFERECLQLSLRGNAEKVLASYSNQFVSRTELRRKFDEHGVNETDRKRMSDALDCLLNMKSIVSVEVLRRMASDYGIKGNDFKDMLTYCHKMGTLLHWETVEVLKEKVILYPQWIVDAICQLIHDRQHHEKEVTQRLNDKKKLQIIADYHQMHSTGKASKRLIENLWSHERFCGHVDYLLRLFSRGLLLASYEKWESDCYVIPALLQTMEKECMREHTFEVSKKWDLCFHPENGLLRAELDFRQSWISLGYFHKFVSACINYSETSPEHTPLVAPYCVFFRTINGPVYAAFSHGIISVELLSGRNYAWDTMVYLVSVMHERIPNDTMEKGQGKVYLICENGVRVSFEEGKRFLNDNCEIFDEKDNPVDAAMFKVWYAELEMARSKNVCDLPDSAASTRIIKKLSPWSESATALYELLKSADRLEDLSISGKKKLFKESCETVLEHAMKTFSHQFTQALKDSGAIKSTAGIWITPASSDDEKKNNFESTFSKQLELMHLFWNTEQVNGSDLSPMELTKECCERIDALALEIIKESDDAVVNSGNGSIFLSHRGPTQKGFAGQLRENFMHEIKFRNSSKAPDVFLDIESMSCGENKLVNLGYAICGAERVVALLDANFFTSEYCVFELFLSCARKRDGYQDNRLLPVYVQDGHIYRRDISGAKKTDGIPLPFDTSISYIQFTPSNPDPRLLNQLKSHYASLNEPGVDINESVQFPSVVNGKRARVNTAKVCEYALVGPKLANALNNCDFDTDRYFIDQDSKGFTFENTILYPMRDKENQKEFSNAEVIIKVEDERVVGYFQTTGRNYIEAYIRNDRVLVFQGQGGVEYRLHPDAVADCQPDLFRFRKIT